MKPSFALDLTEDGITLLHRTSRGWMDVGTVAFADPDLGAALDYLRSTALGLSPKGITTKLIIPESQILYLQIDAAGPDEASRRTQIEAALDGRTPYALDDLVYDWSGSGTTVTVAVVARETLAEAEAFATEHRFNPVSFVSRPEDFTKEPFFGPTALAAGLLAPGEAVEADQEPVTLIAREIPRAEPMVATGISAVEDAVAGPEGSDLPAPDLPLSEPDLPEPELPEPEMPAPGMPEPELPEPAAPEPEMPEPQAPEPDLPEPVTPEPEQPGPQPEPPTLASDLPDPSAALTPGLSVAEPDPAPVEPEPVPAPRPDPAPPEPPAPAPAPVPPASPPPPPFPVPPQPPAPPVEPEPVQPSFVPPPRPATVETPRPMMAARAVRPFADESEAPMAVDVPLEDSGEVRAERPALRSASGLSGQKSLDDVPPPVSAATLMAFSARRPAEDAAARPLGGAAAPGARPGIGGTRPAAPAATRPTVATKPGVERPAAARPVPKFSYDDPLPPPPRMPGDPPTPPASVMGKASKGLRSLGTLVTAPSIPGTRKKKPALNGAAAGAATVKPAIAASTLAPVSTLAAPLEASPAKASVTAAAQSLSRQKAMSPDAIAKGLSARALPQRGKPKYLGLILTGILLLILAIVAAWSSFYLTRGEDAPAEVQIADFEAGLDPEAIADGQLPGLDQNAAAAFEEPDDLPVNVDLSEAGAVLTDDTAEALPEPVAEAVAEAEVTPAPVVAEPAPQTGVQDVLAATTQPGPVNQDEIFLAGMDAPPSLSDPLVLPPPAATGDAPPAEQMPPPPFGTVYQFDADGRIVPTAEGIVTPEGVMLVAGRPAVVPPSRPAAVAAAVPEAAALPETDAEAVAAAVAGAVGEAVDEAVTDVVAAGGDLLPAQTFAADPTLSAARPRVRPEGLAPEPATEDDASLAPAEDSRFASLRPRLRPPAILAAGEAARKASEAASLAVQVAVAEAAAATADEANLSPLAVSVSRVPAPRPRDLSRAVEAAVAAATRRPEPEVVAAASTAAAPAARSPEVDEADDEPEVASAAPRIPTRANVAAQATFVNAINLSKINLIGVYGTQSKRYALVRQPNGRYRKVQVGDTIDGGRVQAITASEVRYQKGGRMLALSMPNG